MGVHRDCHCEALSASRPAHKAEVAELGHLILHDGRVVAQLAAVVVVIAGAEKRRMFLSLSLDARTVYRM